MDLVLTAYFDIYYIHIYFLIFIDTCSKLSSTECSPCKCDTKGSLSTSCDAKGQCKCKDNYYGTKCSNRDCEYATWTTWTKCRCGHEDTKYRSRRINIFDSGEGLPCVRTYEKRLCGAMEPCNCAVINPGYYGDLCENRDCALSSWSSWSSCKSCPTHECYRDNCPTLYPKKRRTRSVKIKQVGHGKGCGGRSDSDSCGYRCQKICYGEGISRCQYIKL